VALTVDAATVGLVIADDGIGIAPNVPVAPGHFGLTGMHERAHLVGGHVQIQSSAAGTTVRLHIPDGAAPAPEQR
jgi:signal transduction histidine kinase